MLSSASSVGIRASATHCTSVRPALWQEASSQRSVPTSWRCWRRISPTGSGAIGDAFDEVDESDTAGYDDKEQKNQQRLKGEV